MKRQTATASRTIDAPASEIYNILADYRTLHPLILPGRYFLSLDLEEGGFGAGTIVRFQMRLLGQTRSFRALISEPEPGRVLLETDLASGVVTRFTVSPVGNGQRAGVSILTELRGLGRLEGWAARQMLQKVYREELGLLARLAEEHALLNLTSV